MAVRTFVVGLALAWSLQALAGTSASAIANDVSQNQNSAAGLNSSSQVASTTSQSSVTASSSASLVDAQIKASAIVSVGVQTTGLFAGFANTFASISDVFFTTTAAGQPFIWTASDVAHFSLSFSGSVTYPSSMNASTILGSKTASQQLVELFVRNNATKQVVLQKYFELGTSLYDPNIYKFDPTDDVTYVPLTNGIATLDVDFNPGGDFSWFVQFGTVVEIDSSFSNVTVVEDYSHTIGVGYIGPDGSLTTSASGLFPLGVSPIPEPETYVLMLVGLVVVALKRRSAKD